MPPFDRLFINKNVMFLNYHCLHYAMFYKTDMIEEKNPTTSKIHWNLSFLTYQAIR